MYICTMNKQKSMKNEIGSIAWAKEVGLRSSVPASFHPSAKLVTSAIDRIALRTKGYLICRGKMVGLYLSGSGKAQLYVIR